MLTIKPIELAKILKKLADPSCGAVMLFLGKVRNQNAGKKITFMEYETYPKMAKLTIQKLKQELKTKFGVKKVEIVHRVGKLKVGEISVVIGVASPHREAAFKAGKYAIDELKKQVPIWKKEYFQRGISSWVKGKKLRAK